MKKSTLALKVLDLVKQSLLQDMLYPFDTLVIEMWLCRHENVQVMERGINRVRDQQSNITSLSRQP